MSFFGHLEPMVGAAGPQAVTGHTRLEMPQRPPPASASERMKLRVLSHDCLMKLWKHFKFMDINGVLTADWL
jgi:hypothetical protein